MSNRIEHEGLGVDFDIPEMTQRQVENWARSQRKLRQYRVGQDDLIVDMASDAVKKAVDMVVDNNLRPSSPAAAAAIEIAARSALQAGADYSVGANMSAYEIAGDAVRAAAESGWLGDVKAEAIDDWRPAKTTFVAAAIQRIVADSQRIDPN